MNYLTKLMMLVCAVLLTVCLKSCNDAKVATAGMDTAIADLQAVQAENETLQVALKNPKVTTGPTDTTRITIGKKPAGATEVTEDPYLDEVAKKLREMGYGDWITIERILTGGSVVEPVFPVKNEPAAAVKPLNNTGILSYDIQNRIIGVGYARRIYKTFEIGAKVSTNIDEFKLRTEVLTLMKF